MTDESRWTGPIARTARLRDGTVIALDPGLPVDDAGIVEERARRAGERAKRKAAVRPSAGSEPVLLGEGAAPLARQMGIGEEVCREEQADLKALTRLFVRGVLGDDVYLRASAGVVWRLMRRMEWSRRTERGEHWHVRGQADTYWERWEAETMSVSGGPPSKMVVGCGPGWDCGWEGMYDGQ